MSRVAVVLRRPIRAAVIVAVLSWVYLLGGGEPSSADSPFPSAREVREAKDTAYVLAQFTPLFGMEGECTVTLDQEGRDKPARSLTFSLERRRVPDDWVSPCTDDLLMFGPDRAVAVLFVPVTPGTYSLAKCVQKKTSHSPFGLMTETVASSLDVQFTAEAGSVAYLGSFLYEDLTDRSNWLRTEVVDNLPTVLELLALWDTGLTYRVRQKTVKVDAIAADRYAEFKYRGRPWRTSLPLLSVARDGDAIATAKALNDGALVEVRDDLGLSALHQAAERGHTEVMGILIAHGADVNAVDDAKEHRFVITDLRDEHVKLESRALPIGDRLVDPAKMGRATPLHRAAYCGHLAAVQLLVEQGADVDARDYADLTPIHRALCGGQAEITDYLAQVGADVEAVGMHEWSMLHSASFGGVEAWVQRLLDRGAEIDGRGGAAVTSPIELYGQPTSGREVIAYPNYTPLHQAVLGGHVGTVGLLLKSGASIDSTTLTGETPLHLAVRRERVEIVDALLAHGANVHAANNGGQTPLHYAATSGPVSLIEGLLAAGANPDARDETGSTCLHMAAESGDVDYVAALLAGGADVHARNNARETPLQVVTRRTQDKKGGKDGLDEKARLLRNHGG